MRKFDTLFATPHEFDDVLLVVSRRAFPTAEDARQEFNRWLAEQEGPDDFGWGLGFRIQDAHCIYPTTIRHMASPDGELGWWLNEAGRGAQPVWVYDPDLAYPVRREKSS